MHQNMARTITPSMVKVPVNLIRVRYASDELQEKACPSGNSSVIAQAIPIIQKYNALRIP